MILIFNAMRKISFIALAVAAMAFASCQQEMAVPEAEGLFRVKGEAATRATVSDLGAFTWSSTDKIAVVTDAGVKTLSYVKGDGIQATFDGDLSGVTSASAAVYPANVAVDANTVNLPSEYDYVEGEVYTPLYIANPSLTEVNEMKHLAGAVKIVIENVPANAAKFVLEANNKMTGEFAIDASGDTPVIKTEATEAPLRSNSPRVQILRCHSIFLFRSECIQVSKLSFLTLKERLLILRLRQRRILALRESLLSSCRVTLLL